MMQLLTQAQREQMLANGRTSNQYNEEGKLFDPFPVVKLFTPDAGATWLLTELDPDYPDIAFGLCDLGMGFPELGSVSLSEITTVRGPMGLPIERDLHFKADRTLSRYAHDARRAGGIRV